MILRTDFFVISLRDLAKDDNWSPVDGPAPEGLQGRLWQETARGIPGDRHRMFPDATKQVVEPAGLREVGVIDVGPYHYAAIFTKP